MTAGQGVPVADRRAPVVGRESEIQALNSSFDKVLDGTRQIVFITGEAGLGKSTLVDHFLQQLANPRIPIDSCSRRPRPLPPAIRRRRAISSGFRGLGSAEPLARASTRHGSAEPCSDLVASHAVPYFAPGSCKPS